MAVSKKQQVANAIQMYQTNPDNFSSEQIQMLQKAAAEVGLDFQPKTDWGRALGGLAFNALDTAMFGLLPNELGPTEVTPTEQAVSKVGNLLGLLVPFAVGGKLAKAGVAGLEDVAAGSKALSPLASILGKAGVDEGSAVGAKLFGLAKTGDAALNSEKVINAVKWATANEERKRALQLAMQVGFTSGTNNFFDRGPDIGGGLLGAALAGGYGMYGGKIAGMFGKGATAP